MVNRILLGGLLIIAAGCGDDAKDKDAAKSADGGVMGTSGNSSAGSSASSAGSSGSSSSNSGSSGSSSSTAGSNSSTAGSSSPGTMPADGAQLGRCENDDDCADGLNCYEFGGYCSTACATTADCSSLGSNFTCNARTGGGGMRPGGMMGGDASAPEPTGTCRATCTGESDTSCPAGMSCVSAGGGGFQGGGGPGGGDGGTSTGNFRCAYDEEEEPGMPQDGGMSGGNMNMGTTPAFGECEDDDECADGLECTAGRTGSGFCTQTCEEDTDCTMMAGSGSAEPTCGFGGNCGLSCAEDGQMCPTGMMCIRAGGGGGGGMAFCGFGGGGGPGGGGPGGG